MTENFLNSFHYAGTNLSHIGSKCHNWNCLNCKKVVTPTIWKRDIWQMKVSHITQLAHEMADFASQPKKLNPNHRKQLKIKTKKLFEKIQNMNFNLSIQKNFFSCNCTYSSACSNSLLIFHFLIKYCHMTGDLDGRTSWYYFNKEIWKITQAFC